MKKVGLVSAKGEGARIEHCLRALARIVDEIVYLDDDSPDDTLERVYRLEHECRIARVIESHLPDRDEGRDRNELLKAGREIGGDRFLVLDADEAFGANADEYMSAALEALEPGEALSAPWIHLWRTADCYRVDPCPWVDNWRWVGFCDDSVSFYPDVWLHTRRIPMNAEVTHKLPPEVAFLHFQFVSWPNVLIKQTWYKFLERLRGNANTQHLNWAYNQAMDETGLRTEPAKPEWFHSFFNEADFMSLYTWRIKEMQAWKRQSPELFTDLNSCPYVD